jgi:hypothetical protein
MKKIAPIVAIALLAVTFTSCKKKYSCDCTIAGVTTKSDLGKQKKSDAETACNNADAAAKLVGGKCELN